MTVGAEDIGQTVEIVIEEKCAECQAEKACTAQLGARSLVNEDSVAFVVIQRKHLVREIADKQGRPAAAIVISRVGAHSTSSHTLFAESNARAQRDIGECAIAVVAVELVGLRVVRYKNIRPAVVIEVKDRNAKRLARGIGDARPLAHIVESAIA